MTTKFEQLIEFVINDEEAKAKELFHEIVIEKSRDIYENIMSEDDTIGGDAADDFIDDVETDEEGIHEGEGEEEEEEGEEEEESGADEELDGEEEEFDGEEQEIEDRVVDLEDKLDELMAEFEALMGGEGSEEVSGEEEFEMEPVDGEVGGDSFEMDDTAEFTDELSENVSLQAAPKPVTSEPEGTNKKSTTAFNSGAAGMAAKPVKMTGDTAKGRTAPSTKDLPDAGKFQNTPGGDKKLTAAPKPVTAQASGVNTKTPFPKA